MMAVKRKNGTHENGNITSMLRIASPTIPAHQPQQMNIEFAQLETVWIVDMQAKYALLE